MAATLKIPETLLKFSRDIAKKQEMVSKSIPLLANKNAASITNMASKVISPLMKKYL